MRHDLKHNRLLGGKPGDPNPWWLSTLIIEVVLVGLAVVVLYELLGG